MSAAQSFPSFRKRTTGPVRRGFTLVELLVVIGIIALLVGLLLPGLAAARHQAAKASCAAKLHNIMVGAQVHANDHMGYFPLAGYLPGTSPAFLVDDDRKHYLYGQFDPNRDPSIVESMTESLAIEMGWKRVQSISGDQTGAAETDPTGFIRNFLCPAQGSTPDELQRQSGTTSPPMLYTGQMDFFMFTIEQSYVFNEVVCGFDDRLHRSRGQQTRVRQPTNTVFAADGLAGNLFRTENSYFMYPFSMAQGMMTFYNKDPNVTTVTLADALAGNSSAGDPACFDKIRHQGRINIAFCDGHVETRNINAPDLAKVYLQAP